MRKGRKRKRRRRISSTSAQDLVSNTADAGTWTIRGIQSDSVGFKIMLDSPQTHF